MTSEQATQRAQKDIGRRLDWKEQKKFDNMVIWQIERGAREPEIEKAYQRWLEWALRRW